MSYNILSLSLILSSLLYVGSVGATSSSQLEFFLFKDVKYDSSCGIQTSGCLGANSKISTPTGQKKISQLKPGDEILSKNEETGKIIVTKVAKVKAKTVEALCTLTVSSCRNEMASGLMGRRKCIEAKLNVTSDHVFQFEYPGIFNENSFFYERLDREYNWGIWDYGYELKFGINGYEIKEKIPTNPNRPAMTFLKDPENGIDSQLKKMYPKSYLNPQYDVEAYCLEVEGENKNYFVEGILSHNKRC